MRIILFTSAALLTITFAFAQSEQGKSGSYLTMRWQHIATKMPSEWYGTDEAKLVAENVLLAQKEIGGWEKNKEYHKLTETEKAYYIKSKSVAGATFDNSATITELRFLAKVYSHLKDDRYKQAFEKGLNFIFISQYENGGWPQFYPLIKGYYTHITYNDNAMVNTMNFLKDIFSDSKELTALQINSDIKSKAKNSFDKGVDCILKSQIIVNGKPTVWCAQHDEKTLLPAKARAYELESFSGAESAGIALLLMNIDNPSNEIIASVTGAMSWFESNKIDGIRLDTEIDKDGKKNKIVVEDKNAAPLWARFYDLETNKPYFCDRDGIKKNSMAEIGYERRNGYGWYTDSPAKVLKKFPGWKAKLNTK